MGNIQVVQPSSRRKNIFDQLDSSQHRQSQQSRSPLSHQNTHRFANSNRVYKIRELDGEDTNRHRNGSYYRVSENKAQRNNGLMEALQQSECNNQSNRIVSFNDFLIEIKKQMTQNSNTYTQNSSQLQQTLKRGTLEEERPPSNEINRELKVNLKLENEKFQLDKYKKIVERELSKSHSIENISLQSRHDHEKLLIIKYGQYNKDPTPDKLKNILKTPPEEPPQITTNLNQKIAQERTQYAETLRQAQRLMKELTERTESLGQLIDSASLESSALDNFKQKQIRNNRISRISDLMSDISHLQLEQIALETQIKAAIQKEDESQISETFTESDLFNIEKRRTKPAQ